MVRAAPVSLAVVLAGSTLPVSAWAQSAWLDPTRAVVPSSERATEKPKKSCGPCPEEGTSRACSV